MSEEKQVYRAYRLARILKTPIEEIKSRQPVDEFEKMAFDVRRRIELAKEKKTNHLALGVSLWMINYLFKFDKIIVMKALIEAVGPTFEDTDYVGIDVDTFDLVRHNFKSKFIGYAHKDGIFDETIGLYEYKGQTYALTE